MATRREKLQKQAKTQNMIMMLIGIGLILIAVAAIIALPKAAETAAQAAGGGELSTIPAEVNFQAPEVQISDLDGNPVAFSDYSGQVILYNSWATWCPPCKAEMPTLQAYYEAHREQGFVIIAVEDGESVAEVAAFVQQYGLTFPVWPDEKWIASESFGIQSLPTSFVIDRNGVARYTWTGAISREMLEKYVTPLLEEN